MKLNFGKRLVLFLHWLFALAGCVIAAIYCVSPNTMWDAFGMVYDKIGKSQTDIIGIACAGIYVILAVASIAIILSNREKREERTFIVVNAGENGRTRIAVTAVEQMIRQAVRGIEDIKSMKTTIHNMGDSISIDSDVIINESSHVPSVAASIQRTVRSYIELNCGVTVKEIFVNVRAMEQVSEKKGRGKKNAESVAPAKPVVRAYEPEAEPVIKEEPKETYSEPEPKTEEEPIEMMLDSFEGSEPETIEENGEEKTAED